MSDQLNTLLDPYEAGRIDRRPMRRHPMFCVSPSRRTIASAASPVRSIVSNTGRPRTCECDAEAVWDRQAASGRLPDVPAAGLCGAGDLAGVDANSDVPDLDGASTSDISFP
jgi:hypothetical protein